MFERVDFTQPKLPDFPQLSAPPTTQAPSVDIWPDVEIPGFRIPSPGFNWHSFRLARQNPQLFFNLLKKIIVEVSERSATRLGEKFDPRNIEFSRFRDGRDLLVV